MSLKRILVWVTISALLFTRISAFAQSSHDQGVAAGNSANTVIRGLVDTPSATSVVPGYTTTPPEAALAGRSYATEADAEVVLYVRDEFCPWNAGRWRVGRDVGRTDGDADLALDVADLASAYLGGFTFSRLAAAERVHELKPNALERADALFRTPRPPYCPRRLRFLPLTDPSPGAESGFPDVSPAAWPAECSSAVRPRTRELAVQAPGRWI